MRPFYFTGDDEIDRWRRIEWVAHALAVSGSKLLKQIGIAVCGSQAPQLQKPKAAPARA